MHVYVGCAREMTYVITEFEKWRCREISTEYIGHWLTHLSKYVCLPFFIKVKQGMHYQNVLDFSNNRIKNTNVPQTRKEFCLYQILYKQKNRWIALSPNYLPRVIKIKQLVNINACGVITSDNNIMSPFIFPNGLRFNTEDYIKCLEEVLLSWVNRMAVENPLFDNQTLQHGT